MTHLSDKARTLIKRIKGNIAQRWLWDVDLDVLSSHVEYRRTTQMFNEAYEQLGKSMIDTYFKENK